jgi:hypothetical protein
MPLCTECGTLVVSTEEVCPRCRHPRWYTLRKVAICFAIVAALLFVIRYLATEFAGRWPGWSKAARRPGLSERRRLMPRWPAFHMDSRVVLVVSELRSLTLEALEDAEQDRRRAA